jgi:predicted transporter
MMLPDKSFWVMALMMALLFMLGVAVGHTHEVHLSDVGTQTRISVTPCPILSGYVIESSERGCYLLYLHRDLSHSGLHVYDNFPRDKDGDCACPKGD